MMSVVIAVHVVVCVILIGLILVQRGRGGGFIESFSGLENMFGTKTSAFLSKATSVLAVFFFCSCLALAFLSLRESRSLMRGVKPKSLIPANATASGDAAAAGEEKKPDAAVQVPAAAAVSGQPANQTAK